MSWSQPTPEELYTVVRFLNPRLTVQILACCRGDSGYIHMARHNHACGVTTDPVVAVFEGKHHGEHEPPALDALPVA